MKFKAKMLTLQCKMLAIRIDVILLIISNSTKINSTLKKMEMSHYSDWVELKIS
jgi:hypothetical protein